MEELSNLISIHTWLSKAMDGNSDKIHKNRRQLNKVVAALEDDIIQKLLEMETAPPPSKEEVVAAITSALPSAEKQQKMRSLKEIAKNKSKQAPPEMLGSFDDEDDSE